MRAARDILIAVIAIGLFAAVGRGLLPVFPALAGVFRGLMNPFVLGALMLTLILLRIGGVLHRSKADEKGTTQDHR